MRNDHMADHVRALRDQRLLIIGDVMLDENLWGEVRRVSPEASVPVVELTRSTHVPGGSANNAANAVALGGRLFLGGVVDDPQADQLRQCLSEHGVDASGLRVDRERPTTTKTRIVAHSQHVVRVDRECRTPISRELERELLTWAKGPPALHFRPGGASPSRCGGSNTRSAGVGAAYDRRSVAALFRRPSWAGIVRLITGLALRPSLHCWRADRRFGEHGCGYRQ